MKIFYTKHLLRLKAQLRLLLRINYLAVVRNWLINCWDLLRLNKKLHGCCIVLLTWVALHIAFFYFKFVNQNYISKVRIFLNGIEMKVLWDKNLLVLIPIQSCSGFYCLRISSIPINHHCALVLSFSKLSFNLSISL